MPDREITAALEKMADALEKIANDVTPEIEIHAGPPICPHCGMFDPEIEIPASPTQHGNLASYIIAATCMNCSQAIYGVVESYSMHKEHESVKAELLSPERKAIFSGEPLRKN